MIIGISRITSKVLDAVSIPMLSGRLRSNKIASNLRLSNIFNALLSKPEASTLNAKFLASFNISLIKRTSPSLSSINKMLIDLLVISLSPFF